MLKNLFILLVASICSITTIAQTTINGSFVHGGLTRDYKIYIPAIYSPGTPVPVVFNLHGYGSNNVEQEFYGDFRPIADTANFIIIHPNGTPDLGGELNWNSFNISTVDDLGFLSRLLDTVIANYSVNTNRVYSTGMSNGGFMSYELACNLNDRFAAVASVTGSMTPTNMNGCTPARPTPIMQIHGTTDGVVPYAGNSFSAPIETLVSNWVTKNGCNPTPITLNVPNTNTTDGCTATHYAYTGGINGATVEFFKVTGGGHTWPGAPIVVDITNMDFSASKEIWRFFSQYSLNQLLSNKELDELSSFTLYPNPSEGIVQLSFKDVSLKNVKICNTMGQIVYTNAIADNKLSVDLTTEKGIYLVTITTEKGQFTNKFILN